METEAPLSSTCMVYTRICIHPYWVLKSYITVMQSIIRNTIAHTAGVGVGYVVTESKGEVLISTKEVISSAAFFA